MARPKLISFDLCPFVQRSVITLLERKVDYDLEFIDLFDKPDWFVKISPFGKVPVLLVGDVVLFESAVINEYLDETSPGPRLLPTDPLKRAHQRAFIEFGSAMLTDEYQLMIANDEKTARDSALALRSKFQRFEGQLTNGPYFAGDSFSLVDAAVAPCLMRALWLERVASDLALFEGAPKVQAWARALIERPSVRDSIFEGMEERVREYLKGKRSETKTTDASWLGRRAA